MPVIAKLGRSGEDTAERTGVITYDLFVGVELWLHCSGIVPGRLTRRLSCDIDDEELSESLSSSSPAALSSSSSWSNSDLSTRISVEMEMPSSVRV